MPDRLERIVSLYEYLSKKLRSINKLMSNYTISTGGRMKQLMTETGESLARDGLAVMGKGGLFGNKTVYISEEKY